MKTSILPRNGRLDVPVPVVGLQNMLLCTKLSSLYVEASPRLMLVDTESDAYTDIGVSAPSGSLIYKDGRYFLICPTGRGNNAQLCLYLSDSTDFQGIAPTSLLSSSCCQTDSWRDPFVFRRGTVWEMLCGARSKSVSSGRRGCVARFISSDLLTWEEADPCYLPGSLSAPPASPCLFETEGMEYLLYTSLSDRIGTQYRFRKSGEKRWLIPPHDLLDSRAFLGVRVMSCGAKLILCGVLPTRACNAWGYNPGVYAGNDYNTWDEGGSLVFHELRIESPGLLQCAPPQAEYAALPLSWLPLNGDWAIASGDIRVSSPYGMSQAISAQNVPDHCLLRLEVHQGDNCRKFGLVLFAEDAFDEGYYFYFEPDLSRVQFRSSFRMTEQGSWAFPQEIELEQFYPQAKEGITRIELTREADIIRLWVNGAALSLRAGDRISGRFGLTVSHGDVDFGQPTLLIPSSDL